MTPASLALHQPLAAPVHRGTGRQGVSLSPHCLAPSQDITSTGPGKGVLESTHPAPWPGPLWTSLLALSKPLRLAMMTPLSGLQVSLSFSGGAVFYLGTSTFISGRSPQWGLLKLPRPANPPLSWEQEDGVCRLAAMHTRHRPPPAGQSRMATRKGRGPYTLG